MYWEQFSPSVRVVEGWVQYGEGDEGGPTPVLFVGGDSPLKPPETGAHMDVNSLDDDYWEELWITPECYDDRYVWRVKLTIELLEQKIIKPSPDDYEYSKRYRRSHPE